MRTSTIGFFLLAFFLPHISFAQNLPLAVNDTLCVMLGNSFHFNVKDNDVPAHSQVSVFLSSSTGSPCIGLTQQGELYFLPNADATCCGLQVLKYRYEGCQGLPDCQGVIFFTIKCPKPDCALVNLEDFMAGNPTGGAPSCASACENSTATYYVPFNPSSTYSWSVSGDISTVTGANPAEIIVTWGPAGAGAITLTTTNPSRIITICVDILPGPTASFAASDSFICCGNSVNFLNNSLNADGWFWDFGDGSTSNMFSPAHAFNAPGTYTVCLYVTKNNYDALGNALCSCTDSTCLNIVVDALKGPQIYCVSTLCAFDSSQYWTNATNCSSYVWNVLDANGNPLAFSGQGTDSISVNWGNGPQGTVALTVLGCDSTFCDDPTSVIIPIIPSTVAVNGLTVVCQNATATYTVPKWLSTYYDWQVTGGAIVSGQGTNTITIHWGPGPTGTINLHYYSNFLGGLPGEDPDNCMGLTSLTVNIRPEFSVNGPFTACLNTLSSFFANPAGTYTWSISPAAPFTGQGTGFITATWNTGPGTYVVTAVPTNLTAFCNTTTSTVIQVLEQLPADTIDGPVQICPGQTYSYFGQTTQTGVGYSWTVTGGTPGSYTGNPVTVTWNAVGPYGLALQLFGTSPPACVSVPIQLAVLPKVLNGPLTITGPLNSCVNGVQNYSAGPAQHPDATYTWTILPATAGSVSTGQGTPNISVQWNNSAGPAMLTLTVNLCTSSLTKTIPVAVTSAAPPTITQTGILCPGVPATLNAGPGYANYAWSSGQNGPGFQMITITSGGTYTVTVTNNFGCTATASYQAIPLPAPVADISTGDPTTLCVNPPNSNTVTIYAQTNPNYTFKWFCNGTLQALPPTQAFLVHTNTNSAGTFLYHVIVTDNNGCKDTSNVILVTQIVCTGGGPGNNCNPNPYTLTITAMNQTPDCNTVAFNVTKSANVTLVGWNFGDPGGNTNTGTLMNAIHAYSKAGCFLATLTATVPGQPNGPCTVLKTQSVCVPLVANFGFSVHCLTVNFNNLTTLLPGSGPITWLWNFGDTFTSTLEHPVHNYAAGGTYMVKLTATNPAGCVSMITLPVFVAGPPTATISVNMNPCVNESVQFLGIGAGITSWLWNFGDGATNALQNPFHAYTMAGTYPVTLTVTDAQGCTNTVTSSVTVHDGPPQDTIAFSPSLTICAGGTVTLTAPGGPYTWLWSAAAGGATTQTVTVTTAGTYSVTVTDANGCTMVPDSVTVVVNPLPSAVVSGNPFICDAGCTTLSVSTGFNYTYVWLDNANNPLVPAQNGSTLQVCAGNLLPGYAVLVTDPNGCTATSPVVVVSLAVSPAFTVTVMPDSCAGMPAILTVAPVQPNVVYSWNNGGTGTTITVLQAGVYNVVGTDTLTGCQGFGSQIIYPLPDLCIVPVGCYEICNPDTICGPDSLNAYQWNLNGVPIIGATNQCLIVTQSGTYTLTGTTAFGCSLTSDSLKLMVVDCSCEQLSVSAEPSLEDSCCWTLSYNNQFGDLYGVVIHSGDTGFNFSGLSDSLQIFSIGASTISLVNSQAGAPLPAGILSNFLTACLTNVVNSPQQIIIDWYDFEYQIACSDTLEFDCPVEPECLYLSADSIYCDGQSVVYTMTVCNPVDNDFEVGYIVLMPTSPVGIVVTPPSVLVSPPMVPGECRDFTFVLTGPMLEGDTFCFSLTAHDTVPGLIDTTHCCMLDTTYCVPIPDCQPCDDIGVEDIISTANPDADFCCYNISLYNNYAANFFDGINLCLLPPASTMTINNPFGSGWSTASYTPTMIELNVVPPLGTSIPLGVVNLPTICVKSSTNPNQQLEVKWMQGDSILCRDTINLFCDPECGYLLDDVVICNDLGNWNFSGLIENTSGFTMGQATFVFTSPAGLGGFNQTIIFPGGLPSGGTYPFNLTLSAPAMPGDTICFTVALHQLNDDAQHINCCNFYDCIVLPECTLQAACLCDAAFQVARQEGIRVTNLLKSAHTGTFSPGGVLSGCDQVVWSWADTPVKDTTYGNAWVTHIFPGFGNFKYCMQVHREDQVNLDFCEFNICEKVYFPPVTLPNPGLLDLAPNPSRGSFYVTASEVWTSSVHFRVINPLGQVIRDWDVQNAAGSYEIGVELGGIEPGVYWLEVRSEGRKWVKKVVVQ